MFARQTRRTVISAVLCAACFGLPGSVRADVRELMGKLPADANTLIVVDVEAVASSPVAKKEGWFEKAGARAGKNPLLIPRGSKQIVVATQLDGDREVKYGISIADLKDPISVDRIALSEGGHKEKFGQTSAVASPGNAYYIQLGDTRLATIFPGERQSAARVASGYHKGIASPYLLAAVNGAGTSPLVMAIDTDGMLAAGDVHKRLDARPAKAIEDNNIDLRAFANLLASMKGVALRVNFDDEVTGTVTIDFGGDTALIKSAVKPLVLETLSRVGLNVIEFSNWTFTASGKQVRGEGKLTAFTLKRLLSLADAPVPASLDPESPDSTDEPAADPEKAVVVASQKYFKKVSAVLDNIHKAPSLGEQATWLRRDAKRISDMPILNVDPELVDWGAKISDNFFAAARQLSTGQMSVRTTSNSVATPSASSTYQGGDGYYYTNESQYSTDMDNYRKQLRAATGAEYEKAIRAAAEEIESLGASRNEIRRKMTEKYKVEF